MVRERGTGTGQAGPGLRAWKGKLHTFLTTRNSKPALLGVIEGEIYRERGKEKEGERVRDGARVGGRGRGTGWD